jgi:protein ImuA
VQHPATAPPGPGELLAAGLARGALHEIHAAAQADLPAATGFAAGLLARAAAGRPVVWARHDALDALGGRLHPPGMAGLGLDPGRVILVRARDPLGALRAGAEAARCPALGAVLIELWGEVLRVDPLASRRLALAARGSGGLPLLLRAAAEPAPSAATTRWLVRAAASRPLAAGAPGRPAFAVTLLRQPGGVVPQPWQGEWDRDRCRFVPAPAIDLAALPGTVAAAAGDRPAAPGTLLRRAG